MDPLSKSGGIFASQFLHPSWLAGYGPGTCMQTGTHVGPTVIFASHFLHIIYSQKSRLYRELYRVPVGYVNGWETSSVAALDLQIVPERRRLSFHATLNQPIISRFPRD